jgi:hypothetical protein
MVHLRPLLTPHSAHTTHTTQPKKPIFELTLQGLKVHHYRLTYDHRSELQIKDFLLSDHARFPVFHIEFQKDSDREKAEKEFKIREKLKLKMKMKMKTKDDGDISGLDGELRHPSYTKPLCAADIEERARISAEEEEEKNACALTISYVQQVQYGHINAMCECSNQMCVTLWKSQVQNAFK